jgi:PAS domain S-box-containing protein
MYPLMKPSRRYTIRQCLMVFATALLTPALILAAVLLWLFANSEQRRYEQEAGDAAYRIISAVDRELGSLQTAAQALASSGALREGDYERFRRQAIATIAAWSPERPDDYAVVVRDAHGQQVVNTRLPMGAPLPKGANLDIDRNVIETRRPHIQDLFMGATAGRPIISVRVPVLSGDEVTHVLSVALEPRRIAEVLRGQILPESWVATVIDRSDRVVGRSRQHEAFLGRTAPEEFRNAATGAGGIWEGLNLEGATVLGAYAQSDLTGWRAFVGVPAEVVQEPLQRSLWTLAGLAGLLMAISVLLATWFGRRIARSVAAVWNGAEKLGAGEPVAAVATGLTELDRVGSALQGASHRLRDREEALRRSEGRLRATHENAAVGIVEVDREGRFVSVNEARCRLTGHSREELIGSHFTRFAYADDRSRDAELFEEMVAGRRDAYTVESRFVRKDGSRGWVRVSSTALRDASGAFLYAVRIVEDITERKRAEERQKLLIDELNHRVKNTLATVQSLAWQSKREVGTAEEAQERFQARLLALSRTHNLLNETSWEGASLRDVLANELEPYGAGADRLRLDGPDVQLPASIAVVLGMAVHELATNAAKYGSLSSGAGQVRVAWSVERRDGVPTLLLAWREAGGPDVRPPERLGFGSRLIRQTITQELMGVLDLRFEPDGVCCTMAVPLESAAPKVLGPAEDDGGEELPAVMPCPR